MANSQLYGKQVYPVPADVLQDIRLACKQYPGNQRAGNLLNSPRLSYENAKRIKNFLETTDVDSPEYMLAGGKGMLVWLNKELASDRAEVVSKKTIKSNAGFENQFRRTHQRTNIMPSHISSSGLKPEKTKRSPLLEGEEGDKAAAVIGIIINPDMKFLLVKRSDDDDWEPGKWALPGGGIDAGEVPEEALIREIQEETRLAIENLVPCLEIQEDNGTWCAFMMAVTHHPETLDLTPAEGMPIEHSDFKWVTADEVKDYDCVPGLEENIQSAIAAYKEKQATVAA